MLSLPPIVKTALLELIDFKPRMTAKCFPDTPGALNKNTSKEESESLKPMPRPKETRPWAGRKPLREKSAREIVTKANAVHAQISWTGSPSMAKR